MTCDMTGNKYFLFSKQCRYIIAVQLLLYRSAKAPVLPFKWKILWKDKHFPFPAETDYFVGLFLFLVL